MKRLLTSAAMFLCSLLTFAQFSGSGSGTESDPYLILNPIQLNQMRNFLNQEGVYFKMMADIDLTEFIEDENSTQGWQPIGNSSSAAFKGVLDGNGKTISGLWINRNSNDYVGLFGYTVKASIKNLNISTNGIIGKDFVAELSGYSSSSIITNCNISGVVKGQSYVGGYIGGSHEVTIQDCCSSTNIEGTGDGIGGFIGSNYFNWSKGTANKTGYPIYGTIKSCRLTSEYVKGVNSVGGLCGEYGVYETISDCFVYSNITGNSSVGGLFGEIHHSYYATYRYSGNEVRYRFYFETKIENSGYGGYIIGNDNVGGIVGKYLKDVKNANPYLKYQGNNILSNSIINCFVVGKIKAQNDYAGGMAGYSIANITNSYVSGTIEGNKYVGGIAGYNSLSLKYSYSNTIINGTQNVGGLCGYSEGNVSCCAAINSRITSTEGNIGRIVGSNNGSLGTIGTSDENKSYNRTIVISQGVAQDVNENEQNGTNASATTLKLKATYVAMGWSFTDIWEIQETECYPYFKTQTAPPIITSKVAAGATTVSGKCIDGGTITLDIDGVTQQMVSSGNEFLFTVSPLQAGQIVRVSAKANGKEQSYYATEIVTSLGSGKENDPYQVYTAADLKSAYKKGYYKLMNDIDLTDYINQNSPSEGWQSIGRDGSETIHFDGNGHKITGLWCNSTRDNTGLFSCFANSTIKNLIVETAKSKQVKGGANTGILIGKMINGTIENCRVSGTVADGTPVGGMVGLFDGGKISLSQANVTINTTGEKSYVGGLVGEITSGEIDQCVTLGTVTATGKESYAGGLVGKNSANVTNCYSNANVTSSYNAAGLIAYNYGIVDKCYATGNLASSNYGAGVIGYNDGANAVIKNSAAMNNKIDVTYESLSAQSGGYGQRIIGGLKNGAPAPELGNYALKTMQVSVNNVPQKVYDDIMNGVSKNGSDLVKASTYQELGWNFSNIWTITEGESYPSLKNNAANVLKPGEDPGPGEDPEPVLSTDDQIVVGEVSASKGKTTTLAIELNNKTTTLSAYQFDLKLPAGFTLSKNDKGKFQVSKTNRYEDESQTLNVSAVEGSSNTYRFICFSLSNSVIEGTSGAILNAIIDAASTVEPGSYEGQISNIVFTKADGTQVKLNSVKFNIVVNNVTKGDVNDDGEINVSDIVEIVNYIMGKPSAKFVEAAADLNEDGEVNVTDIVKVVSIIMSTNNARQRAPMVESTDHDRLTLVENENHVLSLCLNNESGYVASQFDIHLSGSQTLEGIMLNSIRSKDHVLTYTKMDGNTYRVVVYSLGNQAYSGNQGELLSIQVSGTGNIDIDNILFVTTGQDEKRFASLQSSTTGINALKEIETMDIYSIDGCLVRKQVNNTNDLKKGIYIVNGKKQVVR
jgi:hypothetical protein